MRTHKLGAALVAIGAATFGFAIAGAPPAGAATVAMNCVQNPDLTGDTAASFVVSVNAPPEVDVGAPISLTNLEVTGFANPVAVSLTFGVFAQNFSVSGGATPASFTKSAPKQTLLEGEAADLGTHAQNLTAPSVPGTVQVTFDSMVIPVSLDGGATVTTTVTCTPTGANLVATISVVEPPPPGAPNAVADSGETTPGGSTNIDVLDNDEPADDGDGGTLPILGPTVVTGPSVGTATVEVDGTITYAADAGTTATGDSFVYEICSEVDVVEALRAKYQANGELCDTATVTIEIVQAQATTTTTEAVTPTTGVSSASTATDPDELPATGASSTPLGALGVASAIVGLGLLTAGRRRGAVASRQVG